MELDFRLRSSIVVKDFNCAFAGSAFLSQGRAAVTDRSPFRLRRSAPCLGEGPWLNIALAR